MAGPTMSKDTLQQFASGATRSPSRLRHDLIPPAALRVLAERFGIGAIIHGEANWLKGIPFSAMLYHLEEHLQKFKEGAVEVRMITPKDGSVPFPYTDADLENLGAILWGAAALAHYITSGRTELDDRPYVQERQQAITRLSERQAGQAVVGVGSPAGEAAAPRPETPMPATRVLRS